MSLPRAVVIYSLADARDALRAGPPVTLLSAVGAASYAGCGWWRALVQRALADAGRVEPDVLDCADAPGRAVEALRAGCRWVVLAADVPAFADVVGRAALLGAVVLPSRPAALDLTQRGAMQRLDTWLAGGGCC